MKINQILFIAFLFVFFITPSTYSLENNDNESNESEGYRIIFWGTNLKRNPNILEDIKGLTYTQFIANKKIKIASVLPDNFIIKYYWDEQLLEIDHSSWRKYCDEKGMGWYDFFFTIVLNNKIIYHGIDRTFYPSRWPEQIRETMWKYDESNYPAIKAVNIKNEDANTKILVLKPRFYPNPFDGTLRDYDEKEQKKILNEEILKYFEKSGKIIRGKKDIQKILGHEKESDR
jgi:hypothetical protein